MKLSSHALKCFLLPVLAIVAEISVHHQDAVEGEDFMVVKQSEQLVVHDGVIRSRGEAQLSGSFLDKIRGNSGLPSFLYAPSGGYAVQTSVLTESSVPHVDYYPQMVAGTKRKAVGKNELIAFLMLNTNDDAYFSHGESSVPVKEGTIVTFPGNVVHQTVIHSGSVKFLGPFEVFGMQSVGSQQLPPPTQSPVTQSPVTSPVASAIKSAKAPTIKSAKGPSIKSTILLL
jgi:hypothetical protein